MKKEAKKLPKNWEIPVCNNCKSKNFSVLYDNLTYWEYPGKFRIVQCDGCRLVYTSPRPTLKEIGKYYVQENYWNRDFDQQKDGHNDRKERLHAYGAMYRVIRKLKDNGKIFDIGAGTGLLLSEFKENGWEVSGVELMDEPVRYAKMKYGINLKKGDLFDLKYQKNYYDIVVLNGALEHMYKPLETLQAAYTMAKSQGHIVISVPNFDSIGRRLFRREWFPWQPPRHLYHYSPPLLRELLRKAGFGDIHIQYNYYIQNQYILFQSLRYSKSPKFQKSPQGGLAKNAVRGDTLTSPVVKALGKIFAFILSNTLAYLEPTIHKGEVMIVYAKKD